MSCGQDIHTLHAELIHKARDIQFQLAYKNGTLDASIIDINNKNVQSVLESYFSKVGIPIIAETPIGNKNNSNLVFRSNYQFIPETLQVFLSGFPMAGDPTNTNPLRNFNITTTGTYAFKEITFIIAPNVEGGLSKPPLQFEDLFFNYSKRITFNTKGGN